MAKDCKGRGLMVGDKVLIPCVVTHAEDRDGGVNCNVQMTLDAEGGTARQVFSINSAQCEKVLPPASAPAPAHASTVGGTPPAGAAGT